MDVIVEILLEIYMGLMLLIVPEKNIGKKHQMIAKILAIVVIFSLFALAIWGIAWLIEGNLWGILPLAAAIVFSLVQIIVGIILYNKNH